MQGILLVNGLHIDSKKLLERFSGYCSCPSTCTCKVNKTDDWDDPYIDTSEDMYIT